MSNVVNDPNKLSAEIRRKYGEIAASVGEGKRAMCCTSGDDPVSSNLYDPGAMDGIPAEAVRASLGCGDPGAIASLRPGEVVLDLGCGGGIDLLFASEKVGPTGRAIGVDMTDEMIALAKRNVEKSGAENIDIRKGMIESLPVDDSSVDVIISNCVINLSTDKQTALHEAFRVLRPGGRVAISDMVSLKTIDDSVRESVEQYVGCVAGALPVEEYSRLLNEAGFEQIEIVTERGWGVDGSARECCGGGCGQDDAVVASASIRAVKP